MHAPHPADAASSDAVPPRPFRLYNTLSRSVADFEPLQPGKIALYVCGMTVSGEAHVGHARAYVVFDAFVRYVRSQGWELRYVRNFTDVDDKIIRRAAEEGVPPLDLANRYIDTFHRDTAALGLLPADDEPRVSTSMPAILDMISTLIDRGHAYAADGNVWFDVASDDDYGRLSGQRAEDCRNTANADPSKRNAGDFALWKAAKPGEPSWDSPWGAGRPGWHIECSAMNAEAHGPTIDIHGGGLDLVFPHHENEIAQSECAHGVPYARYWMHNGLLTVPATDSSAGGESAKMGKSLGNAFTIDKALKDTPAEAMRLYYLTAHYRSALPWSPTALTDALALLARLYEARDVAASMGGEEDAAVVAEALGKDADTVWELGTAFHDRFHAALGEDFNTAAALAHAFELARAVNRLSNHKKARKRAGPVVAPALKAFDLLHTLGLLQSTTEAFHDDVKAKRLGAMGLTAEDVQAKLDARLAARAAKDWAQADALRDALDAMGILVMDGADGVTWRVRL